MANQEIIKGKCSNGHFYNQSRYLNCPHCAKMKGLSPQYKNDLDPTIKLDDITTKVDSQSFIGISPSADEEVSQRAVFQLEPKNEEASTQNSQQHRYASDNSRTRSYYSTDLSTEPVVGWLIGIKGSYWGECFNLYTGRNEIGRGSGMDVALVDEKNVSRKTHAVVIFEPKHCKFYIQAGESHGLTYLNGEIIVSHKELNNRDIITLGDAVFIFVALCNDKFNWNDTDKYCG